MFFFFKKKNIESSEVQDARGLCCSTLFPLHPYILSTTYNVYKSCTKYNFQYDFTFFLSQKSNYAIKPFVGWGRHMLFKVVPCQSFGSEVLKTLLFSGPFCEDFQSRWCPSTLPRCLTFPTSCGVRYSFPTSESTGKHSCVAWVSNQRSCNSSMNTPRCTTTKSNSLTAPI